jgi:hypothetical protein
MVAVPVKEVASMNRGGRRRAHRTYRERLRRACFCVLLASLHSIASPSLSQSGRIMNEATPNDPTLTLSLAGDVMTGRGVDQALPASVDPIL